MSAAALAPVAPPAAEALPDVFLPYQQELWRAVEANQVTVIEKSRRTGYSWALAAIAAAHAAGSRAAGGSDVLYMGYEMEMTREFIGYVEEWARHYQWAAKAVEEFVFRDPDHPEKDVKAFRVRFASGFEVVALPSVARALRGKQGLVVLDEAAFMDDLAEVLKAAFALLIWGGKVVVCSTHDGDTNPFNLLVEDIRAGRRPYALLRLTFDEALAQGLYRRICLTSGKAWTSEGEAAWRAEILKIYGDNADEELHVIPSPTTGAYLPGPLLEARSDPSVPVFRWSPPAGFAKLPEAVRQAEALAWCRESGLDAALAALDAREPHALGRDFGLVKDLSVDWLIAIGRDAVRCTRLVAELRGVPYQQQRWILWRVLDAAPRLRAVKLDATGNGAPLAQETMQRYGEARVEEVKLSEDWYRQHMPPMKAAIEDAAMTIPRDREVIDDLRMLRLVRGVARIPHTRRTDEGASRHGDAAVAAALAVAAAAAEPEEYGYESAGRAPGGGGPAPRGGGGGWRRPADDDDMPGAGLVPARGGPLDGIRGSV